ncbi:sigma-70 family RNA polymerase sigma factor [Defluviicoccus vanus]|uniref:Sigma-70 family RNA polymerase sigma factor n=1 Tax=Defluviicoccus vanus TaxID=111831 RepID=A0A7H1N090_9PROT|nr:sigma-70 family RNA polymerase sigma factor [Defluviicoccus vanus]QNT69126.1 sigma-70 family RNA polymerase sigma factor [Defluviicoccus vanus]
MQSLEPLTVKMQFDALRQARPELRGFVEPSALLDHLYDLSVDRDEKDRALAGLVTVAQGADPARELAVILLWLALWPGLDALYRRLWRHFAAAPDELVSEISERFIAGIHRLDLGRVRRIAATLLMNVERDIRADLRKSWAEAARRDELPEDGTEIDSAAGTMPPTVRPDSVFGLPPGVDADIAAAMIRETLAAMIGDDADLVVAVVIVGEGQREAGGRLGISHDAARKRYQRSMDRLRLIMEGR